LRIRRLERSDVRTEFNSSDLDLDNYLKTSAWQHQERYLYATTYVVVNDATPPVVIGYYTLSMTSVPSAQVSAAKGTLPKYEMAPAILLGRLAVNKADCGKGLGKALLRDAILRAIRHAKSIACRFMVVEAYLNAAPFYERYQFVRLPKDPNYQYERLVLDLVTGQKAFSTSPNK
jgi:predicted GNAT family N-acyltransferase